MNKIEPHWSDDILDNATQLDRRNKKMFCKECGSEMSSAAEHCPSCGHPVVEKGKKSKTTFVVLALLLGGFGIHRFYLGNIWLGIMMILLLSIGLSPFIALGEAIAIGLRKDDPRFA